MNDVWRVMKKLWPIIRIFKADLWVIAVTGLIVGLCMPLPAKLIEMVFAAMRTHDTETAAWVPFAFPALFLVMGTSRYIHVRYTKFSTEKMTAELRDQIVSKFVRLNLTFHNSFESGSGGLMSRVLNDTNILQDGLFYFVDLFREPVTAAILIGAMVHSNWKLTLFTLVMSPIFIILMRQIRRSLRKYGTLSREAMDDLTGTLKETLDGVRVIQSFNLEDRMSRRFKENQARYLETRRKIISREEAVSPVNEFMASVAVMGLMIFTFKQVFQGQVTPEQFIQFMALAGYVQMPLKKIQNALVKLQQLIIVTDRLYELIDHTSQVPQVANPRPFPHDWRKIEFRDVSFHYGGEAVLKRVSLTVNRGERIALVGESGSGKSTMVNLLERFFDPTEGQILVDGIPLNEFSLSDLRRNIALVTQDVFLFRDTIAHNIEAGNFDRSQEPERPSLASSRSSHAAQAPDSSRAISSSAVAPPDVDRAAQLANADSFIARTPQGFDSSVGERGGFLSGGEKQRISIARAIYKNAPILILDEATSALDSVSELEVQKGLDHLMEGRTVFVIAHRLSTVVDADRIAVMKSGQIVELGTHQELVARQGDYHRFYSLQSR